MLDLDALYGFHEELAGGVRSPRVNAALTYLAEIECYHPDDDDPANRLYYTEDFTQDTIWLPFYGDRPVVTADAATAPDSTTTADWVHGTVYGGLVQTVKVQPSTQYTLSVYVKLGDGTNSDGFLRLGWGGDIVSGFDEYIDQTDPQWASVNSSTWTRVYLTGFTGSKEFATVLLPNAANGKYLQIWGAQFQMGTMTSYRKVASPPTRTLRFSSMPYTSHIDDDPAQTHYESRLIQPGLIRRDLFSPGQPSGAVSVGYGLAEIINTGDLDEYTRASFDGRAYVLKVGRIDQPLRDFTTVIKATMDQAEFTLNRMTIRLKDRTAELNNPITQKKYLGNGTELEGNSDLKDRFKPLIFGDVKYITPVLTHEAKGIYQVSSNPIDTAGIVLYEGGFQVARGADYISADDMIANAPAEWEYRVWPAGGFIRLAFDPTMQITARIYADDDTRNVGEAMKQLALAAGWPAAEINAADVTSLDGLAVGTTNLFVTNGGNAIDLMNQLAQGRCIYFGPDRLGVLRMGRLTAPSGTPALTFTDADIITLERQSSPLPAKRLVLKRDKNWTPQTEFSIDCGPATRQWLSNEWRQTVADDSANAAARKLSPVIEIESLINANEADTAAEAYKMLALYAAPRDIFAVRVRVRTADTLTLDLNDVVSITYPRFGMGSGKLFRVLGIQADYRLGQLDLTLWG